MTQTQSPSEASTPLTSADPFGSPKGRHVTQRELLHAFNWKLSNLKVSVATHKFLPDRRTEEEYDYWFWGSDILYYLSKHTLRYPNKEALADMIKSMEQSLDGSTQVTRHPFPPIQKPAEEKQSEPPALVPPSSVTSPVSAIAQPVLTPVEPATADITKINHRALGNARITDQMMQYMYTEAGVLDVPELKKKIVKVTITLQFDSPELLIPLNLLHFGIDIKDLGPITMWMISAPTVDRPDDLVPFQVVLVNGKFFHLNLEKETEPEAAPDPEDDPATDEDHP